MAVKSFYSPRYIFSYSKRVTEVSLVFRKNKRDQKDEVNS
jgi:hypothetical protein